MKKHIHNALAVCFLFFCALFLSGCFTIEQEIFLKEDGSGTFLIHITLPNPPKKEGEVAKPEEDPEKIMEEIKKGMDELKITGLTVKEVKEVSKNDLAQIYLVFEFQDIKTLIPALKKLEETGNKKADKKEDMNIAWTLDLKKSGAQTTFLSTYAFAFKPEKKDEKKEKTKEEEEWEKMAEDMMMTMLSMAKVRFVLHAPKDFVKTNADMTVGNQAVWEGAMSSFIGKTPKPLQMEATY